MADDHSSTQNLTIAYAARVSLPQLCARLEAYIHTQPAITTLHCCVRHAPSSAAIHNLPEEMISMIGDYLFEMTFENQIEKWLHLSGCLDGHCEISSHLCPNEIVAPVSYGPGPQYRRSLAKKLWMRHENETDEFYQDTMMWNAGSGIEKRVQCFSKYSPIRPYFLIKKTLNVSRTPPSSKYDYVAKASLILPIMKIPLRSSPECDIAHYLVSATIDGSLTAEPSEDQRNMFRGLANKLKLRPFDPHEEMEMMMGLEYVDWEVAKRRQDAYEAKLKNGCISIDDEGSSTDDDDDDKDEDDEEDGDEEDSFEEAGSGAVDVD